MATTFYLKHRPQTFADLDCTLAREELKRTFSSGRFPHAFLFCGPKGIGKTSAARIVAKAVNCTQHTVNSKQQTAKGYEPCNECENCISITNGNNVDILEIDAASNRGIDDIKELREKIRLAPSVLKYKVYIIDEVHMLTTEAFNALLKTLEEPPKHAIFILCTTDPEKLPKTIISRCQRITFKKATQEEIVLRLKKDCEAEKIDYDEDGLVEIVKLADGGFRDAVKLLEQASFAGKITAENVRRIAGVTSESAILEFLTYLKEKKTKEALFWLDEMAGQGLSLKTLAENLLEKLRQQLLALYGVAVDENEKSLGFSEEEIKNLIKLLTRAFSEMKSAAIEQLPLELAVVEWGEDKLKVSLQDKKSEKLKVEDGNGDVQKCEDKGKKSEEKLEETLLPASSTSNFSLEEVVKKWPEILEKVKPLNHSVLAFLKACRPISVENDFLVLEVFYKFHKDQLETEKCRRIFEKSAGEVLSCDVKLKCSLREKSMEAKPLPIVEEMKPASPPPKKKEEDDIIKVAEEIFK